MPALNISSFCVALPSYRLRRCLLIALGNACLLISHLAFSKSTKVFAGKCSEKATVFSCKRIFFELKMFFFVNFFVHFVAKL